MRVSATVDHPAHVEAQWLAVGVLEGKPDGGASPEGSPLGALLERLIQSKDLAGAVGEARHLLHARAAAGAGRRLGVCVAAIVSAGQGRDAEGYGAGVALCKRGAAKRRVKVAVAVPRAREALDVAEALTAGVIVGTRGPGLRKTEPARHEFEELRIVAPPGLIEPADLERVVR